MVKGNTIAVMLETITELICGKKTNLAYIPVSTPLAMIGKDVTLFNHVRSCQVWDGLNAWLTN